MDTRGPETITSVSVIIDVKGASFADEHRCVDFDPDTASNPDLCFTCQQPEDEHHAKTEQSVTWGVEYVLREALTRIGAWGVTGMDGRNLLDVNGQTVGRITIEREEQP